MKKVAFYLDKLQKSLKKSDHYQFLASFSLFFLLLIFFLNPINKFLLLIFLFYLLALYLKTKDLALSAILTFILSSIFLIGKTYTVQLLDLKSYPDLKTLYPLGLVANITISVSDVIFSLIAFALVVNIFKNRSFLKKLTAFDFLTISFMLFSLVSNFISSKRVYLSFIFEKEFFEAIVIYFYLRFFLKAHNKFFKLLLVLFSVIVFFESFLALLQFVASASLGKNFEYVHGIITFGVVPEEIRFVFRPLGTFFHSNYLGIFIASLLPLIFIEIVLSRKVNLFTISYFFGLIALFLTLSRTGWLAFFFSSLFLLYVLEYKFKIDLFKIFSFKKLLIILLLGLPLIFYSLPRIGRTVYTFGQEGGMMLRIKQTKEVVQLIKQNPLTGVGAGMSVVEAIEAKPHGVFASFPSTIHNFYLLLAVEGGLISLLLLSLLTYLALKKISSCKTYFSYAATTSIIVLIIGGLFQPFFDLGLFFLLAALNFDKID